MSKFIKHFEQYPFTIVPITLAFSLVLIVFFKSTVGAYAIVLFGASCLLLYLTSIISFIVVLTPDKPRFGEHTEEIGAVLLAAMWPAIVIGLFAIGWNEFDSEFLNNLPKNFKDVSSSYASNAVYFSAITFTSTGYGDFIPVGEAGRWYATIEAFIGHIHAAIFFAVLFSRVERWRNNHSKRPTKKRNGFSYHSKKRREVCLPTTFTIIKNKNRV